MKVSAKMVNGQRDAADLENTETILEYALGAYQRSVDNFHALDGKASTLAGFIGLILTLAGGLWAVQNKQPSPSSMDLPTLLVQLAYSATVLLLAASAFSCLLTLRTRKNLIPPATGDVISCYQDLGAPESRRRQLIKTLIVSLWEAEKQWTINNQSKSCHLQHAINLLFCAFGCGMTGYLLEVAKTLGIFGGSTP
ncbi:MAG: hypothetical protein ACNA71_09355 [Kiritimatiellia bacterium]